MATTVKDVIDIMQALAPEYLACDGDPIGLHAGSRKNAVSKVMLALDATDMVIDAAVAAGIDMLITHHPRFYRGLKTLDEDRSENALAAKLIRSGMALYCAHTNLDVTDGGVNDTLASIAGLNDDEKSGYCHIETTYRDRLLKLTVFVPDSHLSNVSNAICASGAGFIGNYSECTYRVAGIGTFRPEEGAEPFIGEEGRLEEVEEWRLEAVLPESCKTAVIRSLLEAHPYEEPAYDLLLTERFQAYGLGRMGTLLEPCALGDFAAKLKNKCSSGATCILGAADKMITRAAVWSGSGAAIGRVIASGADVLVCGELSYHDAELLDRSGIAAVVLGHGPCEQIILPVIASALSEALPEIEIVVSDLLWPSFISID